MYLVGLALYVVLCGGVAWALAFALTHRARASWPRWFAAGILVPIVFVLPLADEIVGYFQFERLCKEAKDVKIHGTIPVGEELYTPEGKWRIGLQEGDHDQRLKDWDKATKSTRKYIRWKEGSPVPQFVSAAIPISVYDGAIYDARTGQLLAEWRQYGAHGGWFSRNVVAGEHPLIVRPQCMPDLVERSKLEQALLRFTKETGATK